MFCTNCGKPVKDGARFCSGCGAKLIPTPAAPPIPDDPAELTVSEPVYQPPQTPAEQPQAPTPTIDTPPETPASPESSIPPMWPLTEDPHFYYDPPHQQGTPLTPTKPAKAATPPKPPKAPKAPKPQAQTPQGASTGTQRAEPVQKKSRGPVIGLICGIAAFLAVCVAVVFLFVLTPKNRVGMAFKKSSGAYASAMKKVVAFDYAAAAKKEAFSQELSVNFDSIPDLTLSRSLGLRLRVDANIPDEYLGADLALTAGAESLLTLRAAADGDLLYAGSPELLDSAYYGINTKTLGKDIAAMPMNLDPDGTFSDLSFNIFQLYSEYLKAEPLDPKVTKEFWNALEVERLRSGKLRVNDSSLSSTEYLVTIPSDALADYLEAVFDTYYQVLKPSNLRAMYRAMGLSDSMIENAVAGSEDQYNSSYYEMESLLDAISEQEDDIELTVFVSGGYVVGIDYEGSNDYSDYLLKLRLGGGKSYVNNLSAQLRIDDETAFLLTSTGDHMPKRGVYTDETTIETADFGGHVTCIYEPAASGDNFTLYATFGDGYDDLRLNVSGRIESDKKTMNVMLDDITLADAAGRGDKLSLSLGYVISGFERSFTAKSPVSLFTLSDEEFSNIDRTVSSNFEHISDRIDTLFPDLLWYLF